MAIFIFQKKNEFAERALIEKIIKTNPYLNFEEALNCKCDKTENTTPFLKVVTLLSHDQTHLQKWLLTNDKQQFFIFENKTDQCRTFNFKKDDLIRIKGRLTYGPENPVITLNPKIKSYIEFQGKKYCE